MPVELYYQKFKSTGSEVSLDCLDSSPESSISWGMTLGKPQQPVWFPLLHEHIVMHQKTAVWFK